MKKIRVGVIGVGYLGKFHAEKYFRMKEAQLVGVVDIDKSRAENVAANLGTRALTDYRDLFGKVDAVSVVVPTEAHYSVGAAFLDHDVDVLIEKPMTETWRVAGLEFEFSVIGTCLLFVICYLEFMRQYCTFSFLRWFYESFLLRHSFLFIQTGSQRLYDSRPCCARINDFVYGVICRKGLAHGQNTEMFL